MHLPVNHPLRPLYRAVAVLAGVYLLVFGLVGFFATQGQPFFQPGAESALGLHTNPAFSVGSLAVGAVVVLATLIGKNIDLHTNIWVGAIFMVVGTVMMALAGSDANFLNFTIITTVVSYLIGSVLMTAGMYSKVTSAA